MDFFLRFLSNKVLLSGLSAWILAQVLKLFISIITTRTFDLRRLFGDGGMPSGHAAMVAAVATSSLLLYGIDSFEFAISFIVAIIVSHDATSVRRESGKHAHALNELTEYLKTVHFGEPGDQEKLKEFLGHTHLQVIIGASLGILVALFFCLVLN